MRTSCVIDNYNYAHFVGDAIESALAQTVAFDEIIVVDDVSQDSSRAFLQEKYGNHPTVRLVFRDENGGQLACLQTGILSAQGDIVCLLDSDDQLEPEYLNSILEIYRQEPKVDSVYVACELLRKEIEGCLRPNVSQHVGSSIVLTWLSQTWIGAPTSCLSFRRKCLDQILPYPHLQDWWIRADDFLNFATSLAGARKYYLAKNLVNYRWHEHNQSRTCGDKHSIYQRRIAINRMQGHFRNRLELNTDMLVELAHREYETWDQPSYLIMNTYRKIVFRHRNNLKRACSQWMSITGRYVKFRLNQLLRRKSKESVSLSYVNRLNAHVAKVSAQSQT